jgi:hypothetical protein
MKLTKKAINQIQIEERKKMRDKYKQSEFMKKTLNIYNGQKQRAEENKQELPFTLEEFRAWLCPKEFNESVPFENRRCRCGVRLTIKSMAVDHKTPIARGGEWALSNCQVICKPCNFRKGQLSFAEFVKLIHFANDELSPEGREDVWRRLTLGGKWSFGKH